MAACPQCPRERPGREQELSVELKAYTKDGQEKASPRGKPGIERRREVAEGLGEAGEEARAQPAVHVAVPSGREQRWGPCSCRHPHLPRGEEEASCAQPRGQEGSVFLQKPSANSPPLPGALPAAFPLAAAL